MKYEECKAWPAGATACPVPCPSAQSDICIKFARAYQEYCPKDLRPKCPTCGQVIRKKRAKP